MTTVDEEAAETVDLIDTLGDQLYVRAIDVLSQMAQEMCNMDRVNFSYAERLALMTIVIEGSCSMSHVSKRIGLSRAAMTSAADRLEKDGLVLRVLDPSDRRRTLLEPSLQGIEMLRRAERAL